MNLAMTAAWGEHRHRANIVPKITDEQAKQGLTLVLLRFPAKVLADASGCSIDAARDWKKGKRFPHGAALINLCRALSPIDDWWIAETRPPVSLGTASDQNVAHAYMQQQASLPGPQGDAARAYLRAWRGKQ